MNRLLNLSSYQTKTYDLIKLQKKAVEKSMEIKKNVQDKENVNKENVPKSYESNK